MMGKWVRESFREVKHKEHKTTTRKDIIEELESIDVVYGRDIE